MNAKSFVMHLHTHTHTHIENKRGESKSAALALAIDRLEIESGTQERKVEKIMCFESCSDAPLFAKLDNKDVILFQRKQFVISTNIFVDIVFYVCSS